MVVVVVVVVVVGIVGTAGSLGGGVEMMTGLLGVTAFEGLEFELLPT